MKPETQAEALAFFAALPSSTIRFGLDRIQVALDALGNPEARVPALHVAGTNGKGSTCAFAERALRAQGYRTGLYTSPHLERVNERFRIRGEEISDEVFGLRLLEVIARYPALLAKPAPLTYFEVGTLIAFWHFAQEKVEVAVMETGLGGRLDATTACHPWVTAVTSLSFDHTEYLGNTLREIAREKAGIFKPGVPAVVANVPDEAARALWERARDVGAPLFTEGHHFTLDADVSGRFTYRGPHRLIPDLTLGLRGGHQRQNAAMAVAALEQLDARGLRVSDGAIREGLRTAQWPGRLEEVARHPTVLLDGAHNPGGVEALVAALDDLYPDRRVHLLFGVLADKEHLPMMQRLFPRCASLHLVPVPNPRSLPPEAYEAFARSLCPQVRTYPELPLAFEGARACAAEGELVLCAGSLYLVGAVRSLARSSAVR